MAIPGTVTLTGPIAPTDTVDTYPVFDAFYGLDGLRNISGDTTALNTIPFERRRQGMLVGLNSTTGTTYWRLKPEPWVSATTDWSILINATGGTGGGGGDVTYTNSNPVPATIGGIGVGSAFPNPKTMQEMWDLLLYPYQSPSFTLFSLQGIGSPLEIGADITTNQTFTWGTSNPGNVSANTISINGYNLTTLNGLDNDGSEAVTFTGVVTRGASDGPGIRQWNISAVNTNGVSFGATLNLRWDYRMYVGTSPNTTLTENEIEALTTFNSVKNGFAGTYALPAGDYKYFCFADFYNTPNSFKDASNGINIALNDTYPNTDGNGNTYDLVSVTNSEGETTNYRVYRSKFVLAGAISIVIS
jgi:hypothetical protein